MKLAGIYIHVPFCKNKCDYCNFYSIPVHGNHEFLNLKNNYLKILVSQIKKTKKLAKNTFFNTIYIGGGTPPLLSVNDIKLILSTLNNNYKINVDSEITIECNPDLINKDVVIEYKNIGINRITLGVQTLDSEAYNLIGRKSKLAKINFIKEIANIEKINLAIDLICGIPGLNNDKYLNHLKQILNCNVKHISVYILTIEKNTLLIQKIKCTNKLEKFQKEQFKTIINFLVKNGFEHYEISNFAKDGHYSRHNLKYWQYEEYLGFGPAAHSFFNNKRWSYPGNINQYIKSNGTLKIEDKRSLNSMFVEFFMTGLRLRKGISDQKFYEIFNEKIPDKILTQIKHLHRKDMIGIRKENGQHFYYISKKGFYISDTIIYEIVKDFL